jgi:primosomal protein N' (replication factor Y)
VAEVDPVARVAVDIPLAHLDRPFDYLITAAQSDSVVPGCRVRVRFAGQLVDGFCLERLAHSEHEGRLSPLASVVSPEPVLTPDVLRLARAVADRYVGTLADVLRLAVPPRHAAVERELTATSDSPPTTAVPLGQPDTAEWQSYRAGPAFLRALVDGRAPRAAWAALPGAETEPHWAMAIAAAVAAAASVGRGSLVVLPDQVDVSLVAAALGGVEHVVLTADLGPRERYRRWLQIARGQRRVVVGTRAAVYAPVTDLGLIVVWDDGDDLHAEPRAPYPHVREVSALRATQSKCALLVGGHARTAEVAAWVDRQFAVSIVADRAEVRRVAPQVRASSDAVSDRDPLAAVARLPTVAWRTARDSLRDGPVLVQVPRRGYVPQVVCDRCRSRLHCKQCHGPMGLRAARELPTCQWCGQMDGAPRCATCGHDRLRAAVVGARRTAEELGRAFPDVPVVTSGGRTDRPQVSDRPALVVATPGAEPRVPGGYAAALLLDGWALLGRADLRAEEETVRRWMAASALVRPWGAGGRVVVVADAALRAVQALVRWDPARFAEHELTDRAALGLPPARRLVQVTGESGVVDRFVELVDLPPEAAAFGPSPRPRPTGDPASGWVVTTPLDQFDVLAASVRGALGRLTVRKAAVPRVQVDPAALAL